MKKIFAIIYLFISICSFAQPGGRYFNEFNKYTIPTVSVPVYATWNPSDKDANVTLSNGNLTANSTSNGTGQNVRATIGVSSASTRTKVRWEVKVEGSSTHMGVGFGSGSAPLSAYLGSTSDGWEYWGVDGVVYNNNGATTGPGTPFVLNDIIAFELDMTTPGAGSCKISVNNTLIWTITGLSGTFYPMWGNDDFFPVQCTANFGPTFFYTGTAGYTGLYN